jgi:hypothetical protein
MSRNLKIEKINAYKKMIETKKLPTVKDNAGPRNPADPSTYSVEEQIHMEFADWAEGQLAILLGEDAPQKQSEQYSDFDEDQVMVLRQFADKMIDKANAVPAQAAPAMRQAPQKENRTSNVGGYKPNPAAQPIGNRLRDRQAGPTKATSKQEAYLKELERLDREAPDVD